MKPNNRSVEPKRYRGNHDQILAMVSNQSKGGQRMPAVSLEPSVKDLHSDNWERINNTGQFDDPSCSPTRKKKIIKVKRKEFGEESISKRLGEEEGMLFQQFNSTDNDAQYELNLMNQHSKLAKFESRKETDLFESPESPTRKSPKRLVRPKKKLTQQIE